MAKMSNRYSDDIPILKIIIVRKNTKLHESVHYKISEK